ncbi:folate-sensitive fragile site protein Fra10Ac1-domain-containing protein [Lipomyces orientalis]|uniref:Folate-sensitive fragile site protein Fra10Ac1-domain-containing protein n=1 Tax=Lipomyces orientalis TaxID=1233043 RepID=A0ACC3TTF7_9ASCO
MTDNKDSSTSRQKLAVSTKSRVTPERHRPHQVTERDLLHKHHRLFREDDKDDVQDDGSGPASSESKDCEEVPRNRLVDRVERANEYGKEIAKEYYKKLVKDFPLLDLSKYKEGMVALRWRTMEEFRKNKGGPNGICAEISCTERDKDYTPNAEDDYDYNSKQSEDFLEKRQVLFTYLETSTNGTRQEQKTIMVSCWLCPHHGRRLDKSHEYEKVLQASVPIRSIESRERRRDGQGRRHRHRHHSQMSRSRRSASPKHSTYREGSRRRHSSHNDDQDMGRSRIGSM